MTCNYGFYCIIFKKLVNNQQVLGWSEYIKEMWEVQVEIHLCPYLIYARYWGSFYELYGKTSEREEESFFPK